MFNVYLPKLLETEAHPGDVKPLRDTLWDVVIYTVGGCPGALVSVADDSYQLALILC
jgi:hypothetical protein